VTTPAQYGVPPVPPRKPSGGVIALGVINIIYAVFFRLCCGASTLLLGNVILKMAEMQKTQFPIQMLSNRAVKSYMMIGASVLLILGIFLLISGIGLLMLRPWGRNLSMGVAAAEIVWVILNFAINIFFISPLAVQQASEGASQAQQMVGNVVLQIFGALLTLVYPIVLLICLNLKSIREQFEPSSDWQHSV
jgi:hypothetical protein